MYVGGKNIADVGTPFGIQRRTIRLQSTEGVGAVKDDDFNPIGEAGLHRSNHATDIGVGADADVLKVDDYGIESLQHFAARPTVLSIERVDRKAGAGVGAVWDGFIGFFVTVDAVFWAKEGNEAGIVCAAQDIDSALSVAVDSGGVGQESDALSGDLSKSVFLKDVDTELNGLGLKEAGEEDAGEEECQGA